MSAVFTLHLEAQEETVSCTGWVTCWGGGGMIVREMSTTHSQSGMPSSAMLIVLYVITLYNVFVGVLYAQIYILYIQWVPLNVIPL